MIDEVERGRRRVRPELVRVLASNVATDLAACQRLVLKHKLNVCWHLPHWVTLKRDSTGGGATKAFPAVQGLENGNVLG